MSEPIRYERRMSDADALMWTIEKDPLLRSTITAVSVLDRPPDHERLLERLERGSRLIPRLRQRVVGNPFSLAPPRWEVDPHFDLRYHVRRVNAGGRGDLRDVLDLAEWAGMQGFDRARPLWEFYVVDGLEGGGGALVQKVHHAITDGVGSIRMALTLFDLEREPGDDEAMPDPPPADLLDPLGRLIDGIGHVGRRQAGIARRSFGTIGRAARQLLDDPASVGREVAETVASVGRMVTPATEPLSPVLRSRSLSTRFAPVVRPLDDLKRAAKAAECKLNDAFVAAVLGGLRRYHDAVGASDVTRLRMSMPISIRGDATADLAGNQFVPARFPVPLDIDDPRQRMRAVRAIVSAQRGERALALTEPLAGVLNRLPTTLTTAVFGGMLRGIDLTTSNVPGAPIPLYVAGARIEQQFPFGPLAGAALNITLLSWLDRVCVGVNVDPAAVTDLDAFTTAIGEGFDEVIASEAS